MIEKYKGWKILRGDTQGDDLWWYAKDPQGRTLECGDLEDLMDEIDAEEEARHAFNDGPFSAAQCRR